LFFDRLTNPPLFPLQKPPFSNSKLHALCPSSALPPPTPPTLPLPPHLTLLLPSTINSPLTTYLQSSPSQPSIFSHPTPTPPPIPTPYLLNSPPPPPPPPHPSFPPFPHLRSAFFFPPTEPRAPRERLIFCHIPGFQTFPSSVPACPSLNLVSPHFSPGGFARHLFCFLLWCFAFASTNMRPMLPHVAGSARPLRFSVLSGESSLFSHVPTFSPQHCAFSIMRTAPARSTSFLSSSFRRGPYRCPCRTGLR